MTNYSYRYIRTSDPVKDAENAALDTRPVLGYCTECGCEIHGGNEFFESDEAYCIDDEYVCDGCLREYMNKYKLKQKGEL